jgi:hypothetical protein
MGSRSDRTLNVGRLWTRRLDMTEGPGTGSSVRATRGRQRPLRCRARNLRRQFADMRVQAERLVRGAGAARRTLRGVRGVRTAATVRLATDRATVALHFGFQSQVIDQMYESLTCAPSTNDLAARQSRPLIRTS